MFNGSPLFTGNAGSGESEIRRWIIENDQLEAIVALPEQMFYNTGIGTFIWIVTNRKEEKRERKIQLIDARERYTPMRRSLGDKRRYLTEDTIQAISKEHGKFRNSKTSKVFDNIDFGYRRVTIERPLRLTFQITRENKEQFLDAAPDFLAASLEMEKELGFEPDDDWNEVWLSVQKIAKDHDFKWTTATRKLFRECFTVINPDAKPVIVKRGKASKILKTEWFPEQRLKAKVTKEQWRTLLGIYGTGEKRAIEYEADSKLRDHENIPLKEHVVDFFLREVQPYVNDAWIDRGTLDEQDGGVGKVGYEINFNREFFEYHPPRPLKKIDKDLAAVEKRILKLLEKVTK